MRKQLVISLLWTVSALCISALGCGGGAKPKAQSVTADNSDDDGGDRSGSRRASAPDLEDEDESDDNLHIAGLKGRLDVYDIQQGFNPHVDALSACFTDKVGRQRFIGGEVEFKFVVAPDGTVKAVHLLRSDLGVWAMEKCMLDVTRAMTFVKPKGGGDADFTVPLAFDARQRVALWNEVRGAEEVGDDKQVEIAACAGESGTEDPRNIWVTVYIGTRGKVMSVGFASPDGPLADDWAVCAEAKIKAWQLSDPRGRAKMIYQYNP